MNTVHDGGCCRAGQGGAGQSRRGDEGWVRQLCWGRGPVDGELLGMLRVAVKFLPRIFEFVSGSSSLFLRSKLLKEEINYNITCDTCDVVKRWIVMIFLEMFM